MRTDELNNSHIIAEDGKLLRRISDGLEVGKEIHLGYTYYIGGKKLETPLLEKAEDYEEIDDETPLFEDVLEDEDIRQSSDEGVEDAVIVEEETNNTVQETTKVTVADYYNLKREVEELKSAIKMIKN